MVLNNCEFTAFCTALLSYHDPLGEKIVKQVIVTDSRATTVTQISLPKTKLVDVFDHKIIYVQSITSYKRTVPI